MVASKQFGEELKLFLAISAVTKLFIGVLFVGNEQDKEVRPRQNINLRTFPDFPLTFQSQMCTLLVLMEQPLVSKDLACFAMM